MSTQKQGRKAAAWLAGLTGLLLFGVVWVGMFSSTPAAAEAIKPAAVQAGHVGTEYTFSDFLRGLEGNFVNNTDDVKYITVRYSLVGLDQDGKNKEWAWDVKGYQVLAHDVHFLKFFPPVSLPEVSDQFHYWYMVQTCEDGTSFCEESGRGLFDDRIGNGEYGTLNTVIEIQPDPANSCLVQARYKVHNDPKTALYDDVLNTLIHEEELTQVDSEGWTPWSQVVLLTAGTYRLVATSPDPNIAGIEEKFKVSTPECPPETATATATSTSTSTSTSTTTATPTATRTPVSQGCEYLHAEPNTGKAPLVVTLELRGFGIAMEGGEVRGSNGMVIPVQNSVKLSVVVTESVHFVGTLYDGGKPFTAKQCEADVIVTEDEVTPTPSPVATTGLFFPLVKGGPTVTSTPSMTPSPTPTPVIEKIQGRSCGDPYWKALMNLVLTGKWSVEDDDCSGDELGESYPRVNGKEGHRQIIDALHSFEGGWGLFPDVARYELGNGSAESHTYAVLTNGQQQEIVISNIGRMGTGSPGPIQVIWNGGVVEISAQGVDIAGWWFTPYNARGWQGLEVTKGDTKFLFLQERHHDVYTGWIEYRTPQTSVLGGYWKEAHLLGHLPQNIKDYIIDDSPADAAVNPASLIQTAIAVAAATH